MDERVLTAALVVVAALALGATAATVENVDTPTGDGEVATPTPREELPRDRSDGGSDSCPGPLDSGPGLAAGVAVILGVGAVGYRLTDSALPPLVVVPPALLWLVGSCGTGLPGVGALGSLFAWLFGSPLLLGGGAVLAGLVAVALVYVLRSTEFGELFGDDPPPTEAPSVDPDLDAVGDAAGAAADRIETQADVSNEVYRAWVAMTRHLHVAHPDATTAEEFADAAVDAGMNAGDVERLTDLFRDVRYGGVDPGARADEAVATLRRIEETYAGGDGSDRDDGGDADASGDGADGEAGDGDGGATGGEGHAGGDAA